jgi:glutathione S-transferase
MSDLLLLLGDKNLSSWSLRPWLALRCTGVAFEERVVLFESPGWRERIVEVSPSCRVPVLRHVTSKGKGPLVLWDSLAICEYVAELHPDAKLWPDDRVARALARCVSAEMHSGFAHLRRDLSMDVVARVGRQTHAHETETEIARVVEIWDDCRARYGTGGPFLFGRFSIADAMYAPMVWRFRTYGVALSGRAREWYEAMLALPAMQEWERAAEAEVRAAAALRDADPNARMRPPDPSSAQHCYAVVFSSQLASGTPAEQYEETAHAMVELAKKQPGFLGIESARGADGFGITVSYWDSLQAIAQWKADPRHRKVQSRGRTNFYARYEVRVCTVDRGYKYPA